MGGLIEQLHYTWAPRGAEGINRFQIAAISAGLKTGAMAPLLPGIRKICRYDFPKDDSAKPPVSFGWFDHRDHRIAFCRVGLPRESGQRGTFAAHVLVAPPALLPEAEIASSFGSPFWWTGLTAEETEAIDAGKRDFELPPVALEEILERRVEPAPNDLPGALALAHGLLTLPQKQRLAVVDPEGGFGPALRVLARALPQALAGISLSTYEGTATFPFTVVGGPAPQPRLARCQLDDAESIDPASRSLLTQLLGDGGDAEPLRAAVRAASAQAGEARQSLWDGATRLLAIAGGEAETDDATLRLLADPDTVAYATRHEAGRDYLVEAVTGGAPGVLDALRLAAGRLEPGLQDALCRGFGRRYAATGELGGCGRLYESLPERPARLRMLDEILGVALSGDGAARSLGSEDAALLVERAAANGTGVEEAATLLRGAARHVGACAGRAGTPTAYLAVMFRTALDGSTGDGELVEALRLRPQLLLAAELSEEETAGCLALMRRLDPGRLGDALPALLPPLARRGDKEALASALRRLPDTTAARCLGTATKACAGRGSVPPVLGELCEDTAVAVLSRDLVPLARTLLEGLPSRDGRLAAELLTSIARRSGERPVLIARRAGELSHKPLRSAVFEAAIRRAVLEAGHPDDVQAIWRVLVAAYPDVPDAANLELLLDYGLKAPGTPGSVVVLVWVASVLLPAGPKLAGRGGKLRSGAAEERAREIVAQAPEWCIEQMEAYVPRDDRWAAAWWDGLVAHRRKLAKRARRAGRR